MIGVNNVVKVKNIWIKQENTIVKVNVGKCKENRIKKMLKNKQKYLMNVNK